MNDCRTLMSMVANRMWRRLEHGRMEIRLAELYREDKEAFASQAMSILTRDFSTYFFETICACVCSCDKDFAVLDLIASAANQDKDNITYTLLARATMGDESSILKLKNRCLRDLRAVDIGGGISQSAYNYLFAINSLDVRDSDLERAIAHAPQESLAYHTIKSIMIASSGHCTDNEILEYKDRPFAEIPSKYVCARYFASDPVDIDLFNRLPFDTQYWYIKLIASQKDGIFLTFAKNFLALKVKKTWLPWIDDSFLKCQVMRYLIYFSPSFDILVIVQQLINSRYRNIASSAHALSYYWQDYCDFDINFDSRLAIGELLSQDAIWEVANPALFANMRRRLDQFISPPQLLSR